MKTARYSPLCRKSFDSQFYMFIMCHRSVYLVLNQHGNIHKHVMELFDAAFQPHDILMTSLNLIESLLVDLRLRDLMKGKETDTNEENRAEQK